MNEEAITTLEHDADLMRRESAALESFSAPVIFIGCLCDEHRYCRRRITRGGETIICCCACHAAAERRKEGRK